uniref:Uncharacterized protein n=1 Tax=viral metagenome TaxID=1070528 RepID=A0A6C0L9L9_9ZZZZ
MSIKFGPGAWNAFVADVHKELALKVGVIYANYPSHNAFLDAAIAAGCSQSDAIRQAYDAYRFLEKLSEGDREQMLQYASSTDGPVSLEPFCKKYLADKASAEAAQAAGVAWAMADEIRKKYTAAQEKLRAEKVALEELRLEWIRRTENAAGLQEVADSMNKVA